MSCWISVGVATGSAVFGLTVGSALGTGEGRAGIGVVVGTDGVRSLSGVLAACA